MMRRTLFLYLGAVIFVTAALSQQPSETNMPADMHHSPVSAKVIDAGKNPELVPDISAYRLVFITTGEAPNAAPERLTRQAAMLGKIGLSSPDLNALISVLQDFKVKYASAIALFNAQEDARQRVGATSQTAAFMVQRDQLVQQTRDALKAALTSGGLAALDSYVQKEKQNMKVAAGAVQQ